MSVDMADAGYWDSGEQCEVGTELMSLREQVKKLTKERDELHRAFNRPVQKSEWEKMQEQLAALAEQNEKMRAFLENTGEHSPYCDVFTLDDEGRHKDCTCGLTEALSLPNLASPVLNRIRAEGMEMAAGVADALSQASSDPDTRSPAAAWCLGTLDSAKAIRARADELEKSNGL